MPVEPRNVAPFLSKIRNLLLGREFQTPLRFQEQLATRDPPPAKLPDGPSHKLSANYYLSRDARREVKPPVVIRAALLHPKLPVASDEAAPSKDAGTKKLKHILPGKPYEWKLVENNTK